MMIINIDSGEVRNLLEELRRTASRPRAVLQASAGNVARVIREHFGKKGKRANLLGGRRTHFWSRVRQSTMVGRVTDSTAEVVIGDFRFAQKLFGGPIVAKQARMLTIPVHKDAHGRRASTLESEQGIKLFFIRRKGGGALAAKAAER